MSLGKEAASRIAELASLKAQFGLVPCKLFSCPACGTVGTLIDDGSLRCGQNPFRAYYCHYEWARNFSCGSCSKPWTVCIMCARMKKHLTDARLCDAHDSEYHKKRKLAGSEFSIRDVRSRQLLEVEIGAMDTTMLASHAAFGDCNTTGDGKSETQDENTDANKSSDDVDGYEEEDDEMAGMPSECVEHEYYHEPTLEGALATTMGVDYLPPRFLFTGSNNVRYFEMEHSGRGLAYLVARSQFNFNVLPETVTWADILMQKDIAVFVSGLTKGLREKFVRFTGRLMSLLSEGCASNVGPQGAARTKIPTTVQEVRRFYLEGKNAFLTNLPRPPIRILESHAYVSVIDCIADLLGHGMEVDCITDETTSTAQTTGVVRFASETKRAAEVLANAKSRYNYNTSEVICLMITEWSDGFDMMAAAKSNRGSSWIKTVTISAPRGNYHALTNTYPIAIGKSQQSHEEVEELFAQELRMLASGPPRQFYHGKLKRNVWVHVELFVSLMDQPERRSANHIMLGTSTFAARWGHAGNYSSSVERLPLCDVCRTALLDPSYDGLPACAHCGQWETANENGACDFDVPNDYPESEVPASGMLRPKKLTYASLHSAVELAHTKIVSGDWEVRHAKSYLRTFGLNTDTIENVLRCATNCRSLEEAAEDGFDQDEHAMLMDAMMEDPCMYDKWKIPSLWDRGVELEQHIDAVMHLVFLGVVKTCVQLLQEWTTLRGKYTVFIRRQERLGLFEAIQRLGLDWCKTIPYGGGKLGGWVSENYLAMARILNWIYDDICEVAPDEVFVEPDVPLDDWTPTVCRRWLKARGMPSAGGVLILRQRIEAERTKVGGAREILPPKGGSIEIVYPMISSLHALVSRLMAESVCANDIHDTERHIKMFLSAFDDFDRGMRGETDKSPRWLSSYNFLSLLNLPAIIQRFGPLRNLWEGGGQGEKVLQVIKPSWAGYRKNWHYNLVDGMLRDMAMDRIDRKYQDVSVGGWERAHGHEMTDDDSEEDGWRHYSKRRARNYVVYSSIQTVIDDLEAHKPISIVRTSNGKFGCIIRGNKLVPFGCGDEVLRGRLCYYRRWRLALEEDINIHASGQVAVVEEDECDDGRDTVPERDISHFCLLLPMQVEGHQMGFYTLIEAGWRTITEGELEFTYPHHLGVV